MWNEHLTAIFYRWHLRCQKRQASTCSEEPRTPTWKHILAKWMIEFFPDWLIFRLRFDYQSFGTLAAHFIIRINPSLSTMWFGGLIAQCSLIMSDINFFTATVVWHSFSPLLCFVDSSWQDIIWDSGSCQALPFQIFRVSSFLHSDCWQDNEINLQ